MVEKEIVISICAAAHRIENWLELYKSLTPTNIPFEIVFVTDRKPNFDLPEEFKIIYSTVKPAQCYEIAFRQAKGTLIMWTSDHALFNPKALDYIYELYRTHNNYKNLIALRNYEGNTNQKLVDTTDKHFMFNQRLMPFGCISKRLMRELGGYDNRFICGQSENDLVMRAYLLDAHMLVCDKAIVTSLYERHNGVFNFRGPMYTFEKNLMNKLWHKAAPNHIHRVIPFEPYTNKDILTISQSNKGLPDIYKRTYIWI